MRNRPVTIKDIARRLGISYSTVSRALSSRTSHLVKEQTRLLVQQTAEDMDYSPNLMAQTFLKGKGGVLGLSTYQVGLEIFGRQINHIVSVAGKQGYQVLIAAAADRIASTQGTEQIEQIRQLKFRDVDGILIQTRGDVAESARIAQAVWGKLPVTTFCYPSDEVTGVALDHASGFQEITEHLIGLGHERICFLGEDWIGVDGPSAMGEGYRKAMQNHGLIPCRAPVEAARTESGYNLGKKLGTRFTAFVCCCDYTAIGVCRALIESGVSVPGDVAVTGFGDFEVSAYVTPALTTLTIPFEEIAHAAIQAILRQLQGQPIPRQHVLKPHMNVRESCGAR